MLKVVIIVAQSYERVDPPLEAAPSPETVARKVLRILDSAEKTPSQITTGTFFQAEVAPLRELASTLSTIKTEAGSACLKAYLRNLRVPLFRRADRVVQAESKSGQNGGTA